MMRARSPKLVVAVVFPEVWLTQLKQNVSAYQRNSRQRFSHGHRFVWGGEENMPSRPRIHAGRYI